MNAVAEFKRQTEEFQNSFSEESFASCHLEGSKTGRVDGSWQERQKTTMIVGTEAHGYTP